MSGKKELGAPWKQISVVLRADILGKAVEKGLDISNECNQALANLVGIDYQQQQFADHAFSGKAIMGADTPQSPAHVLHPVINADDPTVLAKLMKTKRQPAVKPVPEIPVLGEIHPLRKNTSLSVPELGQPAAGKRKESESEKRRKDDTLKKFFATKITRVDADDAIIPKDDMYQAFIRWCRDHRCAVVPERKTFATLLKNKFAVIDKTVNGTPCWIHVQLK